MKNATFTFADRYVDPHPERKCLLDFVVWQDWRNTSELSEGERKRMGENTIAFLETLYMPHMWAEIYDYVDFNKNSIGKFCLKCGKIKE